MSLSDKIIDIQNQVIAPIPCLVLEVKDVRTAVQEFIEELKIYGKTNCGVHAGFLLLKLKEKFGKQLCEGDKT